MKKITLNLLAVLSAITLLAQAPQAFKYQTVVRDNTGEILADQPVSFRNSIRKDSINGPFIYVESHLDTTNQLGLVTLEIGNGTVEAGVFENIDWGIGSYYLQIRMDENGGINYQYMGTTQLMSVPYALYSETTGDTTRWRRINDDLYYNEGNVGIGTITPEYDIDVYSNSTAASRLRLSNLDYSKSIFFSSGSELFNPSIYFQGGEALRFMRYDEGYLELMRIQENGNVGIGTNTPDESALLDLNSNSKGMLVPRMTQPELEAITNPANGLQVFNTYDGILYIYILAENKWKEVQYGTGEILLPASYTIGTGGYCINTTVNGNYYEGVPLVFYNTVTLDATVTAIGNWSITTNTINGYSFSGSGAFTTTGTVQLTLVGIGTPATVQTDNFTATASASTCTFQVTVATMPPCPPLVNDIDGNTYNVVLIGGQCWMAENLQTTTYQNGDPIPNVTDAIAWSNLTTGAYVLYGNDISWKGPYGALYNWYAVDDPNGLCPTGWHVPSDDEWTILTDFIGGTSSPHGNELKSCRQVNSPLGGGCNTTLHPRWNENNSYGTDDYGFSGLPGGARSNDGTFYSIGSYCSWWTSTEDSSIDALGRYLNNSTGYVFAGPNLKRNGFSVRCLRDY